VRISASSAARRERIKPTILPRPPSV